ncbi:MAG TPA: hypothetical protein VM871_04300 [Flavisolibacter sp.]|nr:hypothetical protein [Flavisolibacter sp.]
MKSTACCTCLLLAFFLSARQIHGQSSFNYNRYQLKVSPFRAIDMINPGVELSLERNYQRNSFQLSYAYMTSSLIQERNARNYAGNRFAAEWKRFTQIKKSARNYRSAELVYSSVHYPMVGVFGPRGTDTATVLRSYSDSIRLYRKTLSLNVRIGHQFFLLKHFVFDVAFGIGLKYRNVRHTDRLISSDVLSPPRHPNAYHLAERTGKSITVNVPTTFKIGYTF